MTYVYNSLNQLKSRQTIEGETTDDDGNEINNVMSQKAVTHQHQKIGEFGLKLFALINKWRKVYEFNQ